MSDDKPKRACVTCRYAPLRIDGSSRCQATGATIMVERAMERPCGHTGLLWEQRPPQPPRKGVFVRLNEWLFGQHVADKRTGK